MATQLWQIGRDRRIVSSLNNAGKSRGLRRAQHRWRRHAARQQLQQGVEDISGQPKYKGLVRVMSQKEVEAKFLALLQKAKLTPEELFQRAEVHERDGRDALSALVDGGRVVVGKGWKLRVAP